jgi:hypothetical protein
MPFDLPLSGPSSPIPPISGPAYSVRETRDHIGAADKIANKLQEKVQKSLKAQLSKPGDTVTGVYGRIAEPITSSLNSADTLRESLSNNITNIITSGLASGAVVYEDAQKVLKPKPPGGEQTNDWYVWHGLDSNGNPVQCYCDKVPPIKPKPPGVVGGYPQEGPLSESQCESIAFQLNSTGQCAPPATVICSDTKPCPTGYYCVGGVCIPIPQCPVGQHWNGVACVPDTGAECPDDPQYIQGTYSQVTGTCCVRNAAHWRLCISAPQDANLSGDGYVYDIQNTAWCKLLINDGQPPEPPAGYHFDLDKSYVVCSTKEYTSPAVYWHEDGTWVGPNQELFYGYGAPG